MPSLWKRISREDQWSKEVALSPALFAERLSAFVQAGDPDSISFAEASLKHKKALVGKLNESGFRVRERFGWFSGNRHHPVAWAHFIATGTGTRLECHFPGTGTVRALLVFVLFPLLMAFIALGFHVLRENEDLGGFTLFFTGALALILGLLYWQYRSSVGELKDEIEQAIRRSMLDPASQRRRMHQRR